MEKYRILAKRLTWVLGVMALGGGSASEVIAAPQSLVANWASCNELLVPKKQIQGRQVGQENCQMQEQAFTYRGKEYQRVDLRVSGTEDGYSVSGLPAGQADTQDGTMYGYFTSAPEFAFAQFAHTKSFHGTARYAGSAGVGVDVFYPDRGTRWNGKLYFAVTGTALCTWDKGRPGRSPTDALSDVSGLFRLMLEKGYAVAITTKSASPSPPGNAPCSAVTLDTGVKLEDMNFTDHPGIHLGFLKVAKNVLKARLGKEPSRTYWYGKSSGSRLGRLINYKPGLNVGDDGKSIIDGFFQDDAATGLWLPVIFKDGKDVLLATQADKDRFVKQIDVTHQLYVNFRTHPLPDWVSPIYIINKRNNAKLLRDKGLGNKHRMYEIRGVSHSSGEFIGDSSENIRRGDPEFLNLAWLFDGVVDLLDNWVDKGVEPPPTRSDSLELGDINGDGIIDHGAVALPELACPLGLFYPYPPSSGTRGVGSTAFAYFDGKSLEPRDGRGVWVDMNLNGYPDYRESLTQAWRRLGLLKPNEEFSREKYMDCIKSTVAGLKKEGLITERGAAAYLEAASKVKFPSQ